MQTKSIRRTVLRRAVLALSLSAISVSGVAIADSPYSSPSRWNNFRPALDEALADEAAEAAADLNSAIQELPAPKRQHDVQQLNAPAVQGSASRNQPQQPSQGRSGRNQPYQGPAHHAPDHSMGGDVQHMQPTPAAPVASSNGQIQSYAGQSYPAPAVDSMSVNGSHTSAHCGNGTGSYAVGGGYQQAMSAPWTGSTAVIGSQAYQESYGAEACGAPGVRDELYPYFGNAGLTFWQLEDGPGKAIAAGLNGGDLRTSEISPDSSVGFDVGIGRYIKCGKYGVGVNYMLWNPDQEQVFRSGTLGNIRADLPAYQNALIDVQRGGGPANVYDHINDQFNIDGVGTAADDGAVGVRATRDLSFQGIEANLYSFGLMGAQRASYLGSSRGGLGQALGLGHGHGHGGHWGGGRRFGYGGAAGPLVRASSGRVRIMTSHGFRWFQVKDESEFAFNIDGAADYGIADLYDNTDTENNLFGYQFGGRLTYCLGSRLDLNVAGKFGVYANRAEVRHRLGTQEYLAYIDTPGVGNIDFRSEETVLATLGEFDLGLGYRLTNACSIRGGYRVLGVSGVANAIDSRPREYFSVATASQVHADDSYLFHGAYIGAEYNW